MTLLQDEKQGLIDLIVWYRDDYHKKDFCHSQMIREIKHVETIKELDRYWKIVDGWLD